MKPDALTLAVGAVADAVKERLPALIEQALDKHAAAAVSRIVAEVVDPIVRDVRRRIEVSERNNAAACDGLKLALIGPITDAVVEKLPELVAEALDEKVIGMVDLAIRDEVGPMIRETQDQMRELEARVEAAEKTADGTYQLLRSELAADIVKAVATAVAALPPAPPGEKGEPGRDGLDGTIPPAVHWREGRIFARGSCVQHAGGLWYANADTDAEPGAPCSGYSLILDGVLPREYTVDERGYSVAVHQFASGRELRIPMHWRAPNYCGVYDAERAYEPNDLVTCFGSMWWARADSKGAKPGTDAGARVWILAVKCGRDGDPGRDGAKGERGAQGERGEPGAPGRDGLDAKPAKGRKPGANGVAP
jgi:hypothetical protein